MHLASIKLAGFKSFVDPTTVIVKSNLVAVVGPNGSGKSNIIDAVRWVMGESSPKYLRGESAIDVIFNGSSSRKPAAHASIELLFSNTEGRLAGQYASYNQLSIKREVTRDGESHYYLNGVRCRRKDIKDIFLGTGLGPRSYAIIMQDTISRLIEAKPEEFRAYIEEVAGISKYKERRRETELRMQHTHENLERLDDVRDELETQLNKLDRQAKAAERYKTLKQEERLIRAQLYALQWQTLDRQAQQQHSIVLEVETKLEAIITIIRNIDVNYEEKREYQIVANDRVNQMHENYYKIGSEINRLEQAKQHQQQRLVEVTKDHQQLIENFNVAQKQLQQDTESFEFLKQENAVVLPKLTTAKQEATITQEQLDSNEKALHEWQISWDKFNENTQHTKQTIQIEQTRIQHLQQKKQELTTRLEQLQLEQQTISVDEKDDELLLLQNNVRVAEQQQQQLQHQLDKAQQKIHTAREVLQQTQQQLDIKRNQLQQARGKFASLEALQEAALRQKQDSVVQWLQHYALADNLRIAEILKVTTGWEKAVEIVLGHFLEGIYVEDFTVITKAITELTEGNVTFVNQNAEIPINTSFAPSLADHVCLQTTENQSRQNTITAILSMVKAVETLEEAKAILPNLELGQSVITKSGLWLGAGWLRFTNGQDKQQGVIERQKELVELKQNLEVLEKTINELAQKSLTQQQSLQSFEIEREQKQIELRQISTKFAELQATLKAKQVQIKQQHERNQTLIQTIYTLKEQRIETENTLNLAEENLIKATTMTEADQVDREKLLAEREKCRAQLDNRRQSTRECQKTAHELALRYESINVQLINLEKNITRNNQTVVYLETRKTELESLIEQADEPVLALQEQLEILLGNQLQAENDLIQARQKLASIDFDMRELTNRRHESVANADQLRAQLEQQRMSLENIKVRRSTIEEQLQQMEYVLASIISALPVEAEMENWQAQLASIEHRINRLGPINLAAIDEFKEVSERKVYLDMQHEDLTKALQILKTAISKIDKETRQKFKETYDQVNRYFEMLFPKIFGGGSAHLVLTGEDLLDTGITVMARPPGKKNSTIHLLSGGEKALTALALVFSLFQINPAPFCMLDEVDAPLDDINVGRFCNLVKEMAKETQFLFISHNKLAIEMADHLIGVTMREPGVSRLVAVDIQEAISVAEA